ncbi:MAG: hypothetical protein RSG22_11745, partial [Comamonas sp.]
MRASPLQTPKIDRFWCAAGRRWAVLPRIHVTRTNAAQQQAVRAFSVIRKFRNPMSQRKIFVTTALPYANGNFHIGHI